jgi:hypothetical protein
MRRKRNENKYGNEKLYLSSFPGQFFVEVDL